MCFHGHCFVDRFQMEARLPDEVMQQVGLSQCRTEANEEFAARFQVQSRAIDKTFCRFVPGVKDRFLQIGDFAFFDETEWRVPKNSIEFEIKRARLYFDAGYRDDAIDCLDDALYQAQQQNQVSLQKDIISEIDGMLR